MKRLFAKLVRTLLVGTAAAQLGFVANVSALGGPGERALPDLTLNGPVSGEAAIQALGDQLPAVAEAHRMSAQELRRVLREDHASKLDRKGRLFYTDLGALDLAGGAAATGPSTALTTTYPLEQTFLLHSRPGATKLIYLDFDGHVLSGTAWNANYHGGADIVCPAWDTDGNPSSFGASERTAIQNVWRRVAEDYAPFNVDVTTEYPGEAALTRSSSSDTAYGVRILISPISSYFGNYGGIAYVGCYDDVGEYYRPALVFPEKLANGEKYIGEACSHECGHTVGLSHDGTTAGVEYYQGQGFGETGWAPIMGNGYYQNLTQWSKGEYANANNKQDDLAIVAGYVGRSGDDYGNSILTATVLPTGPQVNVVGTIETTGDVDFFRFVTGTGNVGLNATAVTLGPDLDILLKLYDASGNLVTSGNPADTLACSVSAFLTAGTYYAAVTGTGKGDPLQTGYSNYGSLGDYQLSGTVVDPTGNVPPTAVAQANPVSGSAPLLVQFDSSLSSDLDGTIVSYFWDFGDGTSAQLPSPSHIYNNAGTYVATLIVQDNSGLTGKATVTCSALAPNQPPTAVSRVTPSSGYAPLTVTLDGSGSYDPDGTIASYAWYFGDGSTGSGATVQHVYQGAGTFTATLTVTDDRGDLSTATSTVVVQQDLAKVLHVASITLAVTPSGITASVSVRDGKDNLVAGVTVSGTWSGIVNGNATATTSSSGTAVFAAKKTKKSGTVTFTINSLSKVACTYDPSKNVVNSATISAAPTP